MFDTLPNNFYLFFYDTLKCLPFDYQEFNENLFFYILLKCKLADNNFLYIGETMVFLQFFFFFKRS